MATRHLQRLRQSSPEASLAHPVAESESGSEGEEEQQEPAANPFDMLEEVEQPEADEEPAEVRQTMSCLPARPPGQT